MSEALKSLSKLYDLAYPQMYDSIIDFLFLEAKLMDFSEINDPIAISNFSWIPNGSPDTYPAVPEFQDWVELLAAICLKDIDIDVYWGTALSVNNILREINSFLQYGLGHIIIQHVEYCKCRKTKSSPWEHEFLIVTVKESTSQIELAS
ncbi:hypothetical protein IW261DRAFT_1424094 [Armillaria novae-zelandiae]|uniref:Uncharacterized protein n=1 Tax=Armillaria novae-zelandiae TaxID=153914 RepID=A0AA39NVM9_9AGAR|nr:hypothetical protein IW261DRAFT_1424094 [Armillaria novae-zelandiae]